MPSRIPSGNELCDTVCVTVESSLIARQESKRGNILQRLLSDDKRYSEDMNVAVNAALAGSIITVKALIEDGQLPADFNQRSAAQRVFDPLNPSSGEQNA